MVSWRPRSYLHAVNFMIATNRAELGIRLATAIVLLGTAVGCKPSDGEEETRAPNRSGIRLDSSTRTILPPVLTPGVLGRCDRAFPGGENSRWVPSPLLVQRIDDRLGTLLDSVLSRLDSSIGGEKREPEDYYRQYAGVTVRGEQLVYVIGFHRDMVQGAADTAPSDTLQWRSFPVSACDAGRGRFGVVFRVEEQQFSRLEFSNGFGGRVRD